MAENTCSKCRYSRDERSGGQRPAPGTIWCLQRALQMAKARQMSCFSPISGQKPRHCADCKRAKMMKPSGESPQLGNIWCDKKHIEMNKLRSMECFEG